MSVKSVPFTLILPDSDDKSHLFQFIDTPGHPNFQDEVSCGLRMSDGVILMVDIIEGLTSCNERIVLEALK
jgi:U5 small nuclear ribonucleoprotein component